MSDATDHPAYRLFEARFAELRRGRRTETLLTVAIAGLLVLVSVADTEFYPSRIVAGLPRIGEYFGKLFSVVPERGADPVPVLALPHLLGGVKQPQSLAYWFYRIGTYATLLWQTVQMAVLATVMGFTGAFVLSFPAARNLVRNRAGPLDHPATARSDAFDPAGGAGVHLRMAVRHRSARRDTCDRNSFDRRTWKTVLRGE